MCFHRPEGRSPLLRAVALLTLLSACQPTGAGTAGDAAENPDLETRIRSRLDSLDALSSLYAKHLPTGREIAVRADRPMNALSVIKVPIMVLAYREADADRFDLSRRHEIRPEELRRGSGVLQTFDPGLRPTYRDLVTQMIITSDNTATDILIARLGGDRVNELLSNLGFKDTRLLTTTGDLFRAVWIAADSAHVGLRDREVYQRGFPDDPGAGERSFDLVADSTQWLGRTTAREMSRLLEQIHRGELASAESTDAMIRTLSRQFYRSRLPRFLAGEARVAHKTGDWPPIAGNDVGIIYYEGGPLILSVFTSHNRGRFVRLEQTLGRIAEDLVRTWR